MSSWLTLLAAFLSSIIGGYIGARIILFFERLDETEPEVIGEPRSKISFITKTKKRKPKVNDDKAAWAVENERQIQRG